MVMHGKIRRIFYREHLPRPLHGFDLGRPVDSYSGALNQ